MARRKRRRGRGGRGDLPLVQDVLAERVRIDARTLLALIARTNPTDRGLSAEETASQYASKARLQSLLVRRHGPELAVEADQADPGLALLRLRSDPRGGSHARLDALDEEARAWVRLRLDVGTPAGASSGPAQPAGPAAGARHDGPEAFPGRTTEALLALGRQALESYDYEEAQACFEQALAASGGGAAAGQALLELLVEHLAADEEALLVRTRLSDDALGRPAVRALLALAAARAGQTTLAGQLARDLEGPGAAAALRALSGAALQDGDLDVAESVLAAAREQDPQAPELASLDRALADARADRRRPLEDELEALLRSGDLDAAEQQARALLADWPASEVASRVLAQVEGMRRASAIDEAQRSAEELTARGELGAAAARLREALALGAPRQQIEPRLSDLEDRLQAEREERVVGEVRQALDGPDAAAGLLAWLRLDAPLRTRLRADEAGRPELGWLEEAGAPPRGARAREAVQGALAVAGARAALDRGEPQEVLAALEPHGRFVAAVAQARALREEAERRVAAIRRSYGQSRLASAQAALAAGDLPGAREALDEVARPALLGDLQETAAALERSLRRAEHRAHLDEVVQARLSAGDLLAARAAAEGLVGTADATTQAADTARLAELEERVVRAWTPCVLEDVEGTLPLTDGGRYTSAEEVPPCLTPEGGEVVVPAVYGRWLFLRVAEVPGGRVRRAVAVRLPVPESYATVHVEGDRLWVVDGAAGLLEIELPTWRVRRARLLTELGDQALDSAFVVAGGRYLWLDAEPAERAGARMIVSELAGGRVVRELDSGPTVRVLPLQDGPAVLHLPFEGRGSLHRPNGARRGDLDVPSDEPALDAVPMPDGRGLVVLTGPAWSEVMGDEPGAEESHLRLSVLRPDGSRSARVPVDHSHWEARRSLAVAPELRCLFLLHLAFGEGVWLLAARLVDGAVEPLWDVPAPENAFFATDAACRRVVLVLEGPERLELLPLSDSPPEWPERLRPGEAPDWYALERYSKEAPRQSHVDAAQVFRQRLAELEGVERERLVEELLEAPDATPDSLAGLALELARCGDEEAVAALAGRAVARFPDDVDLRVLLAGRADNCGDHAAVRRLLEPVAGRGGDGERPADLAYLLGHARLEMGDPQGAVEAWRSGPVDDRGLFGLAPGIAFVESAFLQEGPVDPDTPAGLVQGIREADRHLARGEADAALARLDRPSTWRAEDLQSMARLAAAALATEPSDGAGWYRKAHVLAAYGPRWERARSDRPPGLDLPLPEGRWGAARLDELAERAQEWLEGDTPGGGHSAERISSASSSG